MNFKYFAVLTVFALLTFSAFQIPSPLTMGKFQVESDLFLAHFDSKTDVDDIHSIAATATILSDSRFSEVRYHAVAGAYGTQGGLYVPANELFEASFDENWSDAHTDYDQALSEVTDLVVNILKEEGDIWIAEAGQSDFTADLIKNVKTELPKFSIKNRIHVVQHSEWNENNTAPQNLTYVKEKADYHKIPDGNEIGNGTPGFTKSEPVNWQQYITNPDLVAIWEMALQIAENYNGKDDRYKNPAIASGGMDFSDVVETCWIFGFNDLENIEGFFSEFASPKD